MIYIIESGDYFKIGYTSNWESRKLAYDTHNPNWEKIALLKGSIKLETMVQRELSPFLHRGEWFKVFPEWLTIVLNIIEEKRRVLVNKELKDLKRSRLVKEEKISEVFKSLNSKNSEFYEQAQLLERWGISKTKLSKELGNFVIQSLVTIGHCYKGVIYRIENKTFEELDLKFKGT